MANRIIHSIKRPRPCTYFLNNRITLFHIHLAKHNRVMTRDGGANLLGHWGNIGP